MKRLFFTFIMLAVAFAASAVPAKRGQWKVVKLADGTEISVELKGDEYVKYWQATDGKKYVRNATTGLYELADTEAMAKRAAARRSMTKTSGLRKSPKAKASKASYTGKKKGLIILVQFSDSKFAADHTPELYKEIANGENYVNETYGFKGSIRDYFKAQSYGKFDLEFDIVGPVTLNNPYSYYGENDYEGDDKYERLVDFVEESCKAALPYISDFSQYDWDGDKEVDQVFLLYAGLGEAANGDASTIWPHEWSFYSATYNADGAQNARRLDVGNGYFIDTYACGPELGNVEKIDGIGTICHEFSHCLGLPDMYDTSGGSNYGMSYWDLMDQGSYNGDGFAPSEYTSYERMAVGWIDPTELKEGTQIDNMKPLGENGEAYIIYNDAHPDEYYMLENHEETAIAVSNTGREFTVGPGLLILHVDYNEKAWNMNVVNSTKGQDSYGIFNSADAHQLCTVIPADNNLYTSNNLNQTIAYVNGDLWTYTSNNGLTDDSRPAAILYNANTDGTYYMHKPVTNITKNDDGTVSFTFMGGGSSAIEAVTEDGGKAQDNRIYSIDGRYVGKDFNALKSGVYIVNGRKILK